MALSPMRCSRECASRFEGLCLRKSMCYVSILARTDQGPRNLWSHLGCAFFAWGPMQLLTTLQVASPERGPDLDVRGVCEAVSLSSVMTHFDLELRILKSEYAALIQKMLRSTKTLKFFGLTYNGVERHYRDPFHQFNVDSLVPLYNCARCLTTHILETPRVKPWIRALLQASSPVKELRFSLFAFCTLECRAFLNALSKNTSLSMLTVPRLGQVPSEYGKFAASARVMDRVTAEIDCIVVYPDAFALPQHVPIGSVTCAVLGRTLSDAAEFGLVAHVCLIVHSVLCSTNETEPSTTPLVQLIRNAPPALASVNIRIESVCCSECWNRLAPPLCDAVHHNTNIRSLLIKLPMKPAMRLLPLAGLLHRNPGLFNFMLDTPCPEVFEEFLREASEPKLWNNYNLEFVEFGCDAPDLVGMVVTMKQVTDRNTTLATRAARFLQGKHNIDNAIALETMNGSSLFVKRVCGLLRVDKVQALDKITACLIDVADMKKFLRLAGVVHRDLVCGETVDGRTQLADLNEDCLRYLRQYLKFSDIRHSPV
uniref:Uncharacterized protein n=1 Tax=Rhipicephalus microplus TaxID=6941 RepID=A0A6M2D1Z9_RHIMP